MPRRPPIRLIAHASRLVAPGLLAVLVAEGAIATVRRSKTDAGFFGPPRTPDSPNVRESPHSWPSLLRTASEQFLATA